MLGWEEGCLCLLTGISPFPSTQILLQAKWNCAPHMSAPATQLATSTDLSSLVTGDTVPSHALANDSPVVDEVDTPVLATPGLWVVFFFDPYAVAKRGRGRRAPHKFIIT